MRIQVYLKKSLRDYILSKLGRYPTPQDFIEFLLKGLDGK